MKRIFGALVLALLLLAAGMQAACAEQTDMQVYIAEGALERETAQRLLALLGRAYPQAEWVAVFQEETGESLREMVLEDRAPQLAICTPQEAAPWAKEGLLVPLDGRISDAQMIQRQVLDACRQGDSVFMAPLAARHRQMIVNRRMLEKRRLSYMMNTIEHPVWYPTEFYQILEEFMLADIPALEIWPAQPQDCAALEALVQAIYGGALLSEDGKTCVANNGATLAGLSWLREMVAGGMITYAGSREEALEHFLAGETAFFIDWTDEEERLHARELRDMDWFVMPYPTASGLPIRSFDVAGVAAFMGTDAAQRAIALQAIAFLHENAQTQLILGDRAIWQDDAIWLPCLSASSMGTTLRSLFCEAVNSVMEQGQTPEQALRVLQAAMEAAN
ncbi:MAG: extracellular solute-binding protein [Clostridia bacterium]|nr:extracellular solute-binding protein [Clostridia bacterium]